MASRRSNSSSGCSGSGCLGVIIALFIMFFLPFILFGEERGVEILMPWWIGMGVLGLVITAMVESDDKNHITNQTITETNISRSTKNQIVNEYTTPAQDTQAILKVTDDYINVSSTVNYISKEDFEKKQKEKIEDLNNKLKDLNGQISDLEEERDELLACVGKPFFVSKRMFLEKQQPEIKRKNAIINETKKSIDDIEKQINEIRALLVNLQYEVFEDSDSNFEALKRAFEQWKKSDNISGNVDIKNSIISISQQLADFRLVQFSVPPYSLCLSNYRFYLFPKSIWVFEDEGKLVGIYNTKALNCIFQTQERTDFGNGENIYPDTTIINKRYTWMHTRVDGLPDMRYKYNPKFTYITYKECTFVLQLCGCEIKYIVSSEKNCNDLKKAIKDFVTGKEMRKEE